MCVPRPPCPVSREDLWLRVDSVHAHGQPGAMGGSGKLGANYVCSGWIYSGMNIFLVFNNF